MFLAGEKINRGGKGKKWGRKIYFLLKRRIMEKEKEDHLQDPVDPDDHLQEAGRS